MERVYPPAPGSPEHKLAVQCAVIGRLNEIESLLTGWVLKHDQDEIAKLTEPLYELCDRD